MNNLDLLPKISIITSTYNCKDTLQATIDSIKQQDYPNIEYIVIDAGSSDGTLEIIQNNLDTINVYVSEPDRGISDAFNKGIQQATGDYLYFIGSGDCLLSPDVLSKMFDNIDSKNDLLLCGRVQRVDISGNVLWSTPFIPQFKKASLLFKMALPHQGLFTHREIFKKYGLFDVENKFCMDYEHLLRYYHQFPHVVSKDIEVASWVEGGIGTNRYLEIFDEYHAIKCKHKVAPYGILIAIHFWTLFKFYIKRVLRYKS
jgi:glycosyltransferase involved in cell wall biosynthesis